jgi:hypothetical protein
MAALATRALGADRCAPGRFSGPRGRLARRRRRGPKGLRAASGAQARNVPPVKARPVTGRRCATPESAPSSRGAHPGAVASLARRAPRALDYIVKKILTVPTPAL